MVALLVASALSSPDAANQAPQQPPPTFRSGTEVVRLDVAVTDKDRRPIRGLTPDDFEILVDGVRQPIVSFSAVEIPPSEPPTAEWMTTVPPDVRANLLGEPRLFVIVMDDAMTPADPYAIQNAKTIARAIVQRLGPGDLAAALFTMNRRAGQDLTGDMARLYAAIDRFNFGLAGGGGKTGSVAGTFSIRTLRDVLEYLRDRPHNRSAVMLVSTGPPLRGKDDTFWRDSIGAREVTDAARANSHSRVPLYFFNIAGLEAPGLVNGQFEWNYTSAVGDPFAWLADDTGGRAIMNTNDPAALVPAVFEENSSYYLVGYRPTHPTEDGRYRRLQVKVRRDGAVVFPRDRMFRSPKVRPDTRRESPLFKAMSDLLPQSDLPLQVATAAFALPAAEKRRNKSAGVLVSLGVRHEAPAAPTVDKPEVLCQVFTVNGKRVASVNQNAEVRLAATGVDSQYQITSRLDLNPGRYALRCSVRSQAFDKIGSVYTDLDVPDFWRGKLSVSSIALVPSPALKAAADERVASLVPVPIGVERAFSRTQDVTTFARIYQRDRSRRAVTVEAVLTNGANQEIPLESREVSSEDFDRDGVADYSLTLPVSALAAGPYLLTIRATREGLREPIVRYARFSVR